MKVVYAVTVDGVLDGIYEDEAKAREAVSVFGFKMEGFCLSGFTEAGQFVRIRSFQMNRGGMRDYPW